MRLAQAEDDRVAVARILARPGISKALRAADEKAIDGNAGGTALLHHRRSVPGLTDPLTPAAVLPARGEDGAIDVAGMMTWDDSTRSWPATAFSRRA
ncbi:hypothetical protein ACGFZQ_50100 [Streptomyces sp. NPDC048254]|uniref:hypothetical protein n=1 Tax=Streptomyces sp. NPDC048254 TaxID=3365525 RepID=UPI00371C5153